MKQTLTGRLKHYLLPFLPYVFIFYTLWRVHDMLGLLPYPDWLVALMGTAALYLVVYVRKKNAKNFRKNAEYGSARWGTAKDIKPYIDPVPRNNIILTATESLTMNSRPKNPKYARNKNVLVIGGSGSGKTRFFAKPNLMQMHSSYVVTDPKGQILIECGKLLQKNGYRIKILNTIQFSQSMKYNPFAYLRDEKDILTLVNTFIANTKGEGKGGDDFWEKSETLLYTALIAYIFYEAPPREHHFGTLCDFISAMEVRENDETFENAIDKIFKMLAKEKPNCFAVRQYKKYKLAAGKTAKSILISCAARLAVFDIQQVRDLLAYDELELDTLGDEKTALFVIISDTNPTFNFIPAIMYSQMFNLLCDKAGESEGGRLKIHVRCILDEFSNVGKIPNFEQLIATMRSREISACVILQSQSQLKGLYKDHAATIIGNMDTTLFLGGKEKETLKEISEMMGKETVDLYNTSVTKGTQESHGQNFSKVGKDLMSVDELAVMDGGKCILMIRGERPFLSQKYDLLKHPHYQSLSDANPKNAFPIGTYLSTRLKPKPEDVFEVYELNIPHTAAI